MKKIISLLLVSMFFASTALASSDKESIYPIFGHVSTIQGNESSTVIVTGLYQSDNTGVVNGQNAYGRITLISDGDSHAFTQYNCGAGWITPGINDPEASFLLVRGGGQETDNYYMQSGCQYRLHVVNNSETGQAKGYIRNYD